MKKLYFFSFLFFCVNTICVAQNDTIGIFVNQNGQEVPEANAVYYRHATLENELWFVTDYYLHNGRPAAEFACQDKSLNFKTGSYISYYPDGQKKESFRYNSGRRYGLQRSWYVSGQLKDSIYLSNELPTRSYVTLHENQKIKTKADLDNNSAGEEHNYYDTDTLDSYGNYTEGHVKNGVWTYYRRNGTICFKQYFDKGRRIANECYSDSGSLQNGDCFEMEEPKPAFDLKNYWDRHLESPDRLGYHENLVVVTLIARFAVTEDGKIEDIQLIEGKGTPVKVHENVYNAVKAMPRWIPGKIFNRPGRVYTQVSIKEFQL